MAGATETVRAWAPQIDIHCHILPAWDDGPSNLDKSLAMIERAVAVGMTTIVATPHVGRKFHGIEHPPSKIAEGVAKLQAEIDERNLKVQIVPGAEVMLGEVDVRARIPAELELTYAGKGKFALIESPFPVWPKFGRSLVDTLLSAGVTPVLAHPERYRDVQKDLDILEPIIKQGALVQLTADAVIGAAGKTMQGVCRTMLKNGWVAFVASDAHSVRETLPLGAVEEVVKVVGEDAARQIFVDNPERMLAGQRVVAPQPARKSGGGFLGRLLGR